MAVTRSPNPPGSASLATLAVCRRIGTHIRVARKRMGYTQAELAERLDLSANFIAHLERGSRRPSLDTLIALSDLLQVPLDAFFKAEGGPAAAPKDRPLVHRAVRLVRQSSDRRVRLVAQLLEQMQSRPRKDRPGRGRR